MGLNVGDTIGDYEVLDVLGSGGMGKVYRVRNTISGRVEAAKLILSNLADDPDLADRFVREIRVHASLEHPNIASLRTALRVDNRLLMIMELVEGATLEKLGREGKVPLADCVRYIDQALSALDYAHSQGVIHRDIKPANMMLTPDGDIKLMDFGIAKASSESTLTKTGFAVGSLYYMSPEQIQGSSELDARSDLYSLGVSFYELLTGKRPFDGDSQISIMAAHLEETPVPPLELDATLPEGLNDVILMAIARDPAQRFQSAQAFQNALRAMTAGLVPPADAPAAVTQSPSAAVPPVEGGAVVPAARPRSGHRLLYMVVGSLATVALLIVALTQLPKWRKTEASPNPVAVSEPADPEPGGVVAEDLAGIAVVEEPASAPEETRDLPIATEPEPREVSSNPTPPSTRSAAPSSQAVLPEDTSSAGVSSTPPAATSEAVKAPPPSATPAPGTSDVAAAAAAAADLEREKALDEMQERLIMMATRIGAVNSGLDVLIREQARSGLSLRGDMTAARQRMEFRMDQAEAAIQSGDPDAAKKQLEFAQRDLEKLERFLNI